MLVEVMQHEKISSLKFAILILFENYQNCVLISFVVKLTNVYNIWNKIQKSMDRYYIVLY